MDCWIVGVELLVYSNAFELGCAVVIARLNWQLLCMYIVAPAVRDRHTELEVPRYSWISLDAALQQSWEITSQHVKIIATPQASPGGFNIGTGGYIALQPGASVSMATRTNHQSIFFFLPKQPCIHVIYKSVANQFILSQAGIKAPYNHRLRIGTWN